MGLFDKLHGPSVAYAATTVGASMMSSVFGFNYVRIFLNRYHVSENWFHVSQIIFMVWNAINDPLFGYIQDNMNFSWVRSRRHSILYGAPLFCLSFLVPWFPWGTYEKDSYLAGCHLLFALCFWDTMFTFVLLAQCALFAEMSKHHEDRVRLIKYTQYASLMGCTAVFMCNFVSSNLEEFEHFQMMTVVLAVMAYFCMRYTGQNALTEYDQAPSVSIADPQPVPPSAEKGSEYSVGRQILQIFTQVNTP